MIAEASAFKERRYSNLNSGDTMGNSGLVSRRGRRARGEPQRIRLLLNSASPASFGGVTPGNVFRLPYSKNYISSAYLAGAGN